MYIYSYIQATAELLYGILNTKVKPTFHKLNVHAGKMVFYTPLHFFFLLLYPSPPSLCHLLFLLSLPHLILPSHIISLLLQLSSHQMSLNFSKRWQIKLMRYKMLITSAKSLLVNCPSHLSLCSWMKSILHHVWVSSKRS